MQCQALLERQQEEKKADRKYGREDRLREDVTEELLGGGGVAKVEGGEGGEAEGAGVRSGVSDGRVSPTSTVTTTRLAADCDCCSNKADSCHKHLLLNMTHACTHAHL